MERMTVIEAIEYVVDDLKHELRQSLDSDSRPSEIEVIKELEEIIGVQELLIEELNLKIRRNNNEY